MLPDQKEEQSGLGPYGLSLYLQIYAADKFKSRWYFQIQIFSGALRVNHVGEKQCGS